MAPVTIRLTDCDASQSATDGRYSVTLIEENGQPTEAILTQKAVDTAAWPPHRILNRFSGAGRQDRDHSDFQEVAKTLYDWLLPDGPVRKRWEALDADTQPRVLLDIRPSTLQRLPWELAGTDRPALTNGMYRLVDHPAVQLRGSQWPFRILVVVGCTAQQETQLGIDKEIFDIRRTLIRLARSVDVHCLYRPTKDELAKRLAYDSPDTFYPHVLHFAGHGGSEPGSAEVGLRFEPQGANPWIWDGDSIRTDLKTWRWAPRFVFLNACRSAAEQPGIWSVQSAFLDRGAQAALGMQADMLGELAGEFAVHLYTQCADGKTLENAVFKARSEISHLLPNLRHIDWAVPSFATTASGIRLLDPCQSPAGHGFEECREFKDVRLFANCHEARRNFTHWIYPPVPVPTPSTPNILVVTGEARSGKSHLLKWCMENWALGGACVRYLQLHGQAQSLLDVLRLIRKGDLDGNQENEYLHAPLPAQAFKQYQWELNNLLNTNEPGEWIAADHLNDPPLPDERGTLTAKGEKRLEQSVCARFAAALKEAAGQRPLILVFDKLSGGLENTLSPSDFTLLIEHLFLPIAREAGSLIKLVFVVSELEKSTYNIERFRGQNSLFYSCRTDYTIEELVAWTAEAFWFIDDQNVRECADGYFKRFKNPNAKGLARLKSILELIALDPRFEEVRRMK